MRYRVTHRSAAAQPGLTQVLALTMNTPRFEMWRTQGGPDANHKEIRAHYEIAKHYRAEVIDAATHVETELNDFLAFALAGDNHDRIELVTNCILTAEFCTFFQKWRLLRSVLSSAAYQVPDKSQQLTMLKGLIDIRNAFAHGDIVVDANTMIATLNYRHGEKLSLTVDESCLAPILENALASYRWISDLIRAQERWRNKE